MKNHYNTFFNISDWVILDRKNLNMYNDDETPFTALKVKIGIYTEENISMHNKYTKKDFDIIRWIAEQEYFHLRKNEGTIIW